MSNTVETRHAEYDEALSLANNGDTDAALDILWDLRLKVDLSIYRRALVNVTLASLLQRADRDKYARECIDLLDLLRQQHADDKDIDEELEHIDDLESAAREILQYNPWLPDSTPQNQPGSNTDLPSEVDLPTQASTSMNVATDKNQSILPTGSGSKSHDDPASQDFGEVVWESGYTPLENAPANLPQIEGFLRDKYYTPVNEGTSTTEPAPAQSSKPESEP